MNIQTALSSAYIIRQIKTGNCLSSFPPLFVLASANKGCGCRGAVEAELYDGNEAVQCVRSV